MAQSWNQLNLPIASISSPLQVELLPARTGRLCVRAKNQPFPQGELYLIVSDWPQTTHYLIPAALEEEFLVADLSGSGGAFDLRDGRPMLTALAVRREDGLVKYPLRASRLKKQMSESKRCLFLRDERKWYSDPVDTFAVNDRQYEVFPGFVDTPNDSVTLCLLASPRSLRFWDQMVYGLTQMQWEGKELVCRVQKPKGAPELAGLSLHRTDGAEQGQRFFPMQDGLARVPLRALPMDGEEYALSGVVERQGEVLRHVPLSVIRRETHQWMEEQCNGHPFRQEGELKCWMRLDDLCRPTFRASVLPPQAQRPVPDMTLEQAVLSGQLTRKGHCAARELGGEQWQMHIELPNLPLTQDNTPVMVVYRQLERYLMPVTVLSSDERDCVLSVDFQGLLPYIQNSRSVRWELDLAFQRDGNWYCMATRFPMRMVRRNLDVDPEYLDYTSAYSKPIGTAPMGDHSVSGMLFCVLSGYGGLQVQDTVREYDYQLACRVDEVSLKGKKLHLRIRCPEIVPGKWTGVILSHRFKLEADRAMTFFPARQIIRRDGICEMVADIDMARVKLSPLYWDIRAAFTGEDGETYLVRAMARRKKGGENIKEQIGSLRKHLGKLFRSDGYRQDKDLSVSLYRTANFGYALVCQEYSPYSGFAFRLKERLAMGIHRLFRKYFASKSIFLCYEKYCCMAQDNGYYFFRYCMENDMERRMGRHIYFVIDKKQPDYKERLLPYRKNVIQFMSLRHMVYLLAARLLISSDSKAHAYAWRAKESVILPRIEKQKKLVFLQHGVIALKRVEFYSKGTNAVQLFVTSNQREHDIIVREMDYPDEDVIITGLARWDVLEDKGLQEKHILVMPTWRNWLEEVSDTAFMTSDYYRSYMALLNDPRMGVLLEKYDLYLDFYIHPKFRDYISNFSISGDHRVRLIPFGTQPLNQLIMGCKMLITDYSSVCWDVYYQGKPVLFYQFDVEQYNESTGSYIDMETELFGDRATDPETLLRLIEQYAAQDFALPQRYAEMRPQMYAYIDHNNSKRTCEEIMKRHW